MTTTQGYPEGYPVGYPQYAPQAQPQPKPQVTWSKVYDVTRKVLHLIVLFLAAIALVYAIGAMETARSNWHSVTSTVTNTVPDVPSVPTPSFPSYPEQSATSWTIVPL